MRTADASDIPRLVELMREFYDEGGYVLNPERAGRAFAGPIEDPSLGRIAVIESDGEPVGYIAVSFAWSMEFGGRTAALDDLFVRKQWRGRGLGKQAVADAVSHCHSEGIRAMHVEVARDNSAGNAVYAAAGFRETNRQLLALPFAEPTHEAES